MRCEEDSCPSCVAAREIATSRPLIDPLDSDIGLGS